MTASNDFIAFATAGGANVETPAAWAADPVVSQGFTSGIAPSIKGNTAWRQSSFVAAAVAQFMSVQLNAAVQDNGNQTTFVTQLIEALQSVSNLYAADAGTTNAYAATFNPAIAAHTVGLPLYIKVLNTNTGASTFNPGPGVKNITTPGGGGLPASAMLAGAIVELIYDGTEYQLSDAITQTSTSTVGSSTNLGGTQQSTTTAQWTADELVAETTLGGTPYKGTSLTFSFNTATTGPNGMDTGSPPTSGDLFIYAIFNPGTSTWACLGTTSGSGAAIYPGAHMPSGYTASALISALKTDGSAHLTAFRQALKMIFIPEVLVLNGGTAASLTSVSITSAVPANTKTVGGWGQTTSANGLLSLAATSTGSGLIGFCGASGSAADAAFSGLYCVGQVIYYETNGIGSGSVDISSYTI